MIQLCNLSFRYLGSDRPSVEDVSLNIGSGECVLLCGASGSGKTSILRLINGLIPHFYEGDLQGRCRVATMDTQETPLYQLSATVGSVYQNPRSQFFNVDTNSEVAFGIENMALPRHELVRRFDRAVETAGIGDLMNRSIFELSGGEKQKIAFASVYAMDPEVVLLDEPSANLDDLKTQELRTHLSALKAEGKTIVICEHRLHFLKGLIDRVIYMDAGKVAGQFSGAEFFAIQDAARIEMGLRTFQLPELKGWQDSHHASPIFEVESLCAGHNKQAVLHQISFEACAGEVIGITGHNGAGKTTLSETLCGLNKPLCGRIRWRGKSVSANALQKLSYMVFQDVEYLLFANSVIGECHYGIDGATSGEVEATLKQLALFALADRHPVTLSGGQKQRLAVAVSMLSNKEIIIFDEPTSGLDLAGMEAVSDIVTTLAAMGKVIFVVTHDLEFMARICSRTLQLEQGRMMITEEAL